MKKLISLLLSAVMLVAVSSCDTGVDIENTTATTDELTTTGNTTTTETTTAITAETEKVEPLPKIREFIDWDTYVMPEPFGERVGGGLVQSARFSWLCHDDNDICGKIEAIGISMVELLVDIDDFYVWYGSAEMSEIFVSNEPHTSLLSYPNLYSFAIAFEIPADEFKQALEKNQRASIRMGLSENDYYTDEEIELLCSYDEARIMERYVSDYSIYLGGKIYPPAWFYKNSPNEYRKAGITAEMLSEKLELYEGFCFTREAAQMFEAKLYEFTGREVDFVDFIVEVTE